MKKKIWPMKSLYFAVFLAAFLVAFLLLPLTARYKQNTLLAQTTSSGEDPLSQDYSLSIEEYNRAHQDYVLAKSQYQKFKTLTAKNKAKDATYQMLVARDLVVEKYLVLLFTRVEENQGISNEKKAEILDRIGGTKEWFKNHRIGLASSGSLEDLVSDSKAAEERHKLLEPMVYESLSEISVGAVNHLLDRLKGNFSRTKEKVNEIRNEERAEYQFDARKLQAIDRWLFETEGRIARAEGKLQGARDYLEKIKNPDRGRKVAFGVKTYKQLLSKLNQTNQDMKDASLFIKEIIRGIKTVD